jgi:MraZ protein
MGQGVECWGTCKPFAQKCTILKNMPDAAANERTYNGLYRHKVDVKRRVPIPFRWRPQESEGEVEFTLIVWPKHQAGVCLRILPPEQLAKLRAAIDAMPNNDPNKSVLKRSIGTASAQAKLDSVGRVTIPDDMAAAADIKTEAVLAGMMDRFEIWSPKRYEQVSMLDKVLLSKAFEMMG